MIAAAIAGQAALAGIMWKEPAGLIAGLVVLFIYGLRVLWITPLLTPAQLPDGTFTAGLEVATYAAGYQVAIGLESDRLRWWLEMLAYLIPGTNIGVYTYQNGNRCYELSIHVQSARTASRIGRLLKQESIWDWSTKKLVYLK